MECRWGMMTEIETQALRSEVEKEMEKETGNTKHEESKKHKNDKTKEAYAQSTTSKLHAAKKKTSQTTRKLTWTIG